MTERLDMERESKVRWENSFGASKPETKTMKITAWACADRQRGGFEIYDIESGGEDYYGEGGMWFDDNGYLTDYDGCGSLDNRIIEWLDGLGMVSPDERCFFRERLNKMKVI